MALVNKIIPGFFNGISQQSPVLRLETQCEDSVNAYGTLQDGLIKRYPTDHIKVLSSNADTTSFIHTVNRDEDERYNVIITGDSTEPIEVFKLTDGTKCSVRYGQLTESLVFTEDSLVKAYATSASPIDSFKATTISDYTLISNTSKVGAMDGVASSALIKEGLIYVKQGVAATDYQVSLDGDVKASYSSGVTTAYDTYKSSTIAKALYNQLAVLDSGQLKIDFSAISALSGTYALSIEGDAIGGAVSVVTETVSNGGEPETFTTTALPEATATAFANEINAHINTAAWYVTSIGTSVIIRKIGSTVFTSVVTTAGGATAPVVTQPTEALPWVVTYRSGENIIKIQLRDNTDFTLTTSDSWGDQALFCVKGSIQNFTDLPALGYDGFMVEIAGSPDSSFDNYWVKFVEDTSTGVWQEIAKPGIVNNFLPSTLPHRLVRTALNEFTFCPILWSPRVTGDTLTMPEPSFIGTTINDVFFYRNRLGILSGENFILSKASDFFNFWGTTATTVLDDDNIDYAVSANEVATLHFAAPFNASLLCFSDRQQFQIGSGGNTLTAKNITADPTTTFSASKRCKPVNAGSNVYFVSPRGDSASIREYFVQPNSLTNDAAEVTAHVNSLLPKNISRLAASSILDTLVCMSPDVPGTLYIYKYFWNGDEKAQSAWFKWEFDGTLLSADFIDSYLYILIEREGQICLERLRFEKYKTGLVNYKVQLDRQIEVTGVFNGTETTWSLPYEAMGTYTVVDSSTGGKVPGITQSSSSSLVASGDYSGRVCYIGITYTKRHTLSEWHLKTGQGNVAVQQGNLIMRTITLSFTNTGYFRLEVTPLERPTAFKDYNPIKFGTYITNTSALGTETVRFPINAKAEKTVVAIVNDSHLPSEIQAGSYEGTYISRSQSV